MFCSRSAVVDFHVTRNACRPDNAGAHGALSFGHTDETKRTAERHRRRGSTGYTEDLTFRCLPDLRFS